MHFETKGEFTGVSNKNLLIWAGPIAIIIVAGLVFVLKDRGASGQKVAQSANILLMADNAKTVAQGQQIYADNCASCHGANLEGQPDWRNRNAEGYLPAPPHDETGHTWHHADALLFGITKFGIKKYAGDPNYKTNMPAYENKLSDAQIIAVLSYIKSTWPTEIRNRHDTLNQQ